jgi:hypothetical protein
LRKQDGQPMAWASLHNLSFRPLWTVSRIKGVLFRLQGGTLRLGTIHFFAGVKGEATP